MVTFRNRLPARNELFLVFSVCAFVIYVWSILSVLKEVPAWILRLNLWDLIGIIAYTQLFALFETILTFLAIMLLAVVLPARLFKKRFVAQASMVVLLTSLWVVLAHYNDQIIGPERLRQLAMWLVIYLVSIGVSYLLIHRYRKLEEIIYSLANRLTVLSSVYIAVGILSALVVLIRNI